MDERQVIVLPADYDDRVDLRDLFRDLYARKWFIIGTTFTAAVISVIVALMLPNIYRAEALLAPNDAESAGGLSALASQYAGLASLARIGIGDGSADKTQLGIQILKSRKFISGFIERRSILVPLMAAHGWDPSTGKLQIDLDVYDVEKREWVEDDSGTGRTIPSMQKAYEKFMGILSVRQDDTTGFVTLSVEHYSPTVAKQWVDWLIEDLNAAIMRRDVSEAEQSIEYLKEQIDSTAIAELQSVFFNLIEEQTKTIMLANVSDEYLLRTLDPAIAPEMKAKPRRSFLVVFITAIGFFGSVAAVLIFSWLRKGSVESAASES